MDDYFTYAYIETQLSNIWYHWGEMSKLIEQIISVSDVKIAYPKKFCDDKDTKCRLLLFTNDSIYDLELISSGSITVTIHKIKNIVNMTLKMERSLNATLIIKFATDEIVISSTDSLYEYQTPQYSKAIREVAKLYS